MANGKKGVQQHPTAALTFQTAGGFKEEGKSSFEEGLRGWTPCCKGSSMGLVWQSNMGISWYERIEGSARDLSVMTASTVQIISLIIF